MSTDPLALGESFSLAKAELGSVINELALRGYEVYGPTVHEQALGFGRIGGMADMAIGYRSEEEAGRYQLFATDNGRTFDAPVGADSVKRFLFPPRSELFGTKQQAGTYQLEFVEEPTTRRALLGVRACDLAAIEVLDRTFADQRYPDPIYRRRRQHLFILAADCHSPGATCFCHSMGTGPRAETGYDLALSELEDCFLLRVGSQLGADILATCSVQPASEDQLRVAEAAIEVAIENMGRAVETDGLPELLLGNLDHPRWDDVACRCLNCTNCTLVCPTCFCWDVKDETDLPGDRSLRVRVWDSCFSPDHSYHAGGGSARPDVRSRYRQWLTHKLGSWVHQFGVSGCVGCGRCITWCPAAIDITEEVAALRGVDE